MGEQPLADGSGSVIQAEALNGIYQLYKDAAIQLRRTGELPSRLELELHLSVLINTLYLATPNVITTLALIRANTENDR